MTTTKATGPDSDLTEVVVQTPRAAGPTNSDGDQRSGARGGDAYHHLNSLLADYAATPADQPRRAQMREQLISGYLPLAHNIARRYAQRGEPLDDLTQVASIGLVQAIERYQPEHGSHFLAFAVPTITGEIRRYFRDKSWSMRVPRRLKDLHLSINSVLGELSQQLDHAPRPSDIAARLEVPVADVLDALEAGHSYRADSLDQLLGTESPTTVGDLFGQPDPRMDRFVNYHSLAPALATLPARQRDILIMRFYDDMTQTQIAAKLGLSQMHISRLLSQTLTQLRRQLLDQPPPPHEHPEAKVRA